MDYIPIEADECLALTLRYLATGECYHLLVSQLTAVVFKIVSFPIETQRFRCQKKILKVFYDSKGTYPPSYVFALSENDQMLNEFDSCTQDDVFDREQKPSNTIKHDFSFFFLKYLSNAYPTFHPTSEIYEVGLWLDSFAPPPLKRNRMVKTFGMVGRF